MNPVKDNNMRELHIEESWGWSPEETAGGWRSTKPTRRGKFDVYETLKESRYQTLRGSFKTRKEAEQYIETIKNLKTGD